MVSHRLSIPGGRGGLGDRGGSTSWIMKVLGGLCCGGNSVGLIKPEHEFDSCLPGVHSVSVYLAVNLFPIN